MQLQGMMSGRISHPDMSYTDSGLAITRFSMPSEEWDSKTKTSSTQWIKVVVFGPRAEFINQYAVKGSIVCVTGDIRLSAWKRKDGTMQTDVELRANKIDIVSGFKKAEPSERGVPDMDLDDKPF